jgi:hypothetical protein
MSNDRISISQLIRIAEGTAWEAFEAMPDGRLLLQDHAQTLLKGEEPVNQLLWVFEMRVGLHFERPVQAIMSCGHFIRMRSADNWTGYSLKKLVPEQPDICLYRTTQLTTQRGWRPTYSGLQDQQSVHDLQNQPIGTSTIVWLSPSQYPPPGLLGLSGQLQATTDSMVQAVVNSADWTGR